jgi:hypothetical protein
MNCRHPMTLPRLLLATVTVASLSGCATRGCDNPYVLDYIDNADRSSDLAYLGLVRDAVRTDPGPKPNTAYCSVWQRIKNPAYGSTPTQPESLLRPQHYTITQVDHGWRIVPTIP